MNDHLRKWLARTPTDERERVAQKALTTVGHLRQLAGGHRKASPELAERLQEASSGDLTIAALRPDLLLLAEKILKGIAPLSEAIALPTLNQKIRPISPAGQSADDAGNSSSTSSAA